MDAQAYEILSLAMRYWFAALAIIVAASALRLQHIQARAAHKERHEDPNLEYIGELLVIKGARRGDRYPIQRDIVIGRSRRCDVIINDRSVRKRHARAELRSGGLYIAAISNAPISLRGQPLKPEFLARDGALFCVGEVMLQLTLYDIITDYPDEEELVRSIQTTPILTRGTNAPGRTVYTRDPDDSYEPGEGYYSGERGGSRGFNDSGANYAGYDDYDSGDEYDAPRRGRKETRRRAAQQPAVPAAPNISVRRMRKFDPPSLPEDEPADGWTRPGHRSKRGDGT